MLSLPNVFYYFSIIICSFLTAAVAAYFLTRLILDSLMTHIGMFLYGTSAVGVTVLNQLVSFIN